MAVLLASPGCREAQKPPTPPPPPKAASAEPNSYAAVTARLDAGGSLFLYISTERWLSGLSQSVSAWRRLVETVPAIPAEQKRTIGRAFDVVARGIQDSGVQEISGLGMSSLALEPGFYRNKWLLHHYRGKNAGLLWRVFGARPHALTGLDLLPATTVAGGFQDLDLATVWGAVQQAVASAGIPEAQEWLGKAPALFEATTGLKLEQALSSLAGEFGFALTLDDTRKVTLPIGSAPIELPEPGLFLAVRVKDDTLFERVDQLLKDNPAITRTDQPGLRKRTLALPLSLPFALRPTLARAGDYLFLTSHEDLLSQALAGKGSGKPSLRASAEFQRLAKGLPTEGNGFWFVSSRLGATLGQTVQRVMSAGGALPTNQAGVFQPLLGLAHIPYAYTVRANSDEGFEVVGNGSREMGAPVLASQALQPVAVVGLLASIAIPNFVKARSAAQLNVVFANLAMLEGAKAQWELEKKKAAGDLPTREDLAEYLRDGWVHPVVGETYRINPIGQPASAKLPRALGNHPAGAVITRAAR